MMTQAERAGDGSTIRALGRLLVVLTVGVSLGVLSGCGDGGGGPRTTARSLTADGWDLFEAGEAVEALARFEEAVEISQAHGEAYNGIGWCCVRLDSLVRGIDSFETALANGVTNADPLSGLAIIYRDLEPVSFQSAADFADSALALDPDYAFDHDPTFDWHDLRLILAQSLIGLNRYEDAKAEVDILNPWNTLDPAADTFIEDLIAEVQRLGEQF
jgi:tetratricopeptide (TPR) repeat protein